MKKKRIGKDSGKIYGRPVIIKLSGIDIGHVIAILLKLPGNYGRR